MAMTILTSPSEGVANDGHDNANADLILSSGMVLEDASSKCSYTVIEMLGQGTFGQVVKCTRDAGLNGTSLDLGPNEVGFGSPVVAVKVIKNQPAYYHQALVEISVLKLLNEQYDPHNTHHIVRLLDHFVFQKHLCIVFELLTHNLFELIRQNQFKGLSLKLVRLFTKQLLDALVVLRSARVIHCDLKPENVLLKSLNGDIKLIDFGSACLENRIVYSYIQSRFYRSPEVILGYPYTSAIDMWSLGCVAAELFLGLPLFPGASEFDLLQRMVEMLGTQPPDHMLRASKNASKFFKQSPRSPPRPIPATGSPRAVPGRSAISASLQGGVQRGTKSGGLANSALGNSAEALQVHRNEAPGLGGSAFGSSLSRLLQKEEAAGLAPDSQSNTGSGISTVEKASEATRGAPAADEMADGRPLSGPSNGTGTLTATVEGERNVPDTAAEGDGCGVACPQSYDSYNRHETRDCLPVCTDTTASSSSASSSTSCSSSSSGYSSLTPCTPPSCFSSSSSRSKSPSAPPEYVLLTAEEFAERERSRPAIGKRYFKERSLRELILGSCSGMGASGGLGTSHSSGGTRNASINSANSGHGSRSSNKDSTIPSFSMGTNHSSCGTSSSTVQAGQPLGEQGHGRGGTQGLVSQSVPTTPAAGAAKPPSGNPEPPAQSRAPQMSGLTASIGQAERVERMIFADFLRGLVEMDSEKRWTPQQALLHPFITEVPAPLPFDPPPVPQSAEQGAAAPSLQSLLGGPSSLPGQMSSLLMSWQAAQGQQGQALSGGVSMVGQGADQGAAAGKSGAGESGGPPSVAAPVPVPIHVPAPVPVHQGHYENVLRGDGPSSLPQPVAGHWYAPGSYTHQQQQIPHPGLIQHAHAFFPQGIPVASHPRDLSMLLHQQQRLAGVEVGSPMVYHSGSWEGHWGARGALGPMVALVGSAGAQQMPVQVVGAHPSSGIALVSGVGYAVHSVRGVPNSLSVPLDAPISSGPRLAFAQHTTSSSGYNSSIGTPDTHPSLPLAYYSSEPATMNQPSPGLAFPGHARSYSSQSGQQISASPYMPTPAGLVLSDGQSQFILPPSPGSSNGIFLPRSLGSGHGTPVAIPLPTQDQHRASPSSSTTAGLPRSLGSSFGELSSEARGTSLRGREATTGWGGGVFSAERDHPESGMAYGVPTPSRSANGVHGSGPMYQQGGCAAVFGTSPGNVGYTGGMPAAGASRQHVTGSWGAAQSGLGVMFIGTPPGHPGLPAGGSLDQRSRFGVGSTAHLASSGSAGGADFGASGSVMHQEFGQMSSPAAGSKRLEGIPEGAHCAQEQMHSNGENSSHRGRVLLHSGGTLVGGERTEGNVRGGQSDFCSSAEGEGGIVGNSSSEWDPYFHEELLANEGEDSGSPGGEESRSAMFHHEASYGTHQLLHTQRLEHNFGALDVSVQAKGEKSLVPLNE